MHTQISLLYKGVIRHSSSGSRKGRGEKSVRHLLYPEITLKDIFIKLLIKQKMLNIVIVIAIFLKQKSEGKMNTFKSITSANKELRSCAENMFLKLHGNIHIKYIDNTKRNKQQTTRETTCQHPEDEKHYTVHTNFLKLIRGET